MSTALIGISGEKNARGGIKVQIHLLAYWSAGLCMWHATAWRAQ